MTDHLATVKTLLMRLGLEPRRRDSAISDIGDSENDDCFIPNSDVIIKVTDEAPRSSVLQDPDSGGMTSSMVAREAKRSLTSTKSVPLNGAPEVQKNQLERKMSNVKRMLDVIHTEMMAMRRSDQDIAKQFLKIYSDIQEIKVQQSCLGHKDLLDQAAYEAEKADEVPDVCDVPTKRKNTILTHLGVTWMNINARRFSCS